MKNIEKLSPEELENMEDELVKAEEDNDEEIVSNNGKEETSEDIPTDQDANDGQNDESRNSDALAENDQQADHEELSKHVTPPSKWAKQRHERRQMVEDLKRAQAEAAKAEKLESELQELRKQFSWLKNSIESKGMDVPDNPLDVFSKEKLNDVRDEHGDEVADMFQALVEVAKGGGQKVHEAAKEKGSDPIDESKKEVSSDTVDQDFIEAVESNDELSYWRRHATPLFRIAQDMDDRLLTEDPEKYMNLPFEERLREVVELVKKEVTKRSRKVDHQQDEIPSSLSNSGGTVPQPTSGSSVDRILATNNPDEQMKIYHSLSEKERDEVDKSLGI